MLPVRMNNLTGLFVFFLVSLAYSVNHCAGSDVPSIRQYRDSPAILRQHIDLENKGIRDPGQETGSSTTTARPTTAKPTTARPTTAKPTTAKPTTAKPTTAKPTTAKPTTPPNMSTTQKPTEDIFPPALDGFEYKFHSTLCWNLSYPDGLDNKESPIFKQYKEQVKNGLDKAFSQTQGLKTVNVNNFISGSVIAAFDLLFKLDTAVKNPGSIDASLVDGLDNLEYVYLEGIMADSDYIVLTTKPAMIKELQRLRSDETKHDVCNSSLYQGVCPRTHLCVVTLEEANSPIACKHRCLSHSCTYMGSDQFVECVLGADYSPSCRCKDDALLVDDECVDEWQVIGPVLAVGLIILALVGAAIFYRHRAKRASPASIHSQFANPIDLDPTSSTY